jgi:hypothetical protein
VLAACWLLVAGCCMSSVCGVCCAYAVCPEGAH